MMINALRGGKPHQLIRPDRGRTLSRPKARTSARKGTLIECDD